MKEQSKRICRTAVRAALVLAFVLTLFSIAALVSFWRMPHAASVQLTRIEIDGSQARSSLLLSVDARLEGLDTATHGLSATGGHCDAFTKNGTGFRLMLGPVDAGPEGARFTFEIGQGSHAQAARAWEGGLVVGVTCKADLVVNIYKTGLTMRRTLETGDLIGDEEGTPATTSDQRASMRIKSGHMNVAWPTTAGQKFAVEWENHLELAVPVAAVPGLVRFLQRTPVHVKADLRYVDTDISALEITGLVDSLLQVKMEGDGPRETAVVSLPIRSVFAASSSLVGTLVAPLLGASEKPLRSVVFKASSPKSPMAVALGTEHTLGFQRDPSAASAHDLYDAVWGHGRSLSPELHQPDRSEAIDIWLNQLLTVDNDTMARIDVNFLRNRPTEIFVDLSFVFRQLDTGFFSSRLDSHEDQHSDATEVRVLLDFDEDAASATLSSSLQLLQNWSGERALPVAVARNASNDTLALGLVVNVSEQRFQLSGSWNEILRGSSGTPASVYNFNIQADLDGQGASRRPGFCTASFEAPDLRVLLNWTVWEASADSEEHVVSLSAAKPPGRSVYLGELSTPGDSTEQDGVRRMFDLGSIGLGGSGGGGGGGSSSSSWYSTTSFHGMDATCGASTARRWTAEEKLMGVAIRLGMTPGADPGCFAGSGTAISLKCNTTSGVVGTFVHFDSYCWTSGILLGDQAAGCLWDSTNLEYALSRCVATRQDVPAQATVHMLNGQVERPATSTPPDSGHVPPPKSGFANAVTVESGLSTTMKLIVSRNAGGATVITGRVEEENTCNVRSDSEFETAASARWLPPGFEASDPQCRICPFGSRGFAEYADQQGQKQILDYCIPSRFTQSCCVVSTWEDILNPALASLDLQMTGQTALLGSASWDRTRQINMTGNWSHMDGSEVGEFIMTDAASVPYGVSVRWASNAQGGRSLFGELRDSGLAVVTTHLASIDEPDRIGLNFNLTAGSEALGNLSSPTVVAGSALWDIADERHGPDGFLAEVGASLISSGDPKLIARATAHFVSEALSRGVRLVAAMSTPDPVFGVEAAMALSRSSARSLLGAFAQVNGSAGNQLGHARIQIASDNSSLICSGAVSDEMQQLIEVRSALAKSSHGGDLHMSLEEKGVVTTTAQGWLNKNDSFYAGKVAMQLNGNPTVVQLAVNASDGFTIESKPGYKDFSASISGATDHLQGSLVVHADADLESLDIAGFGWDVSMSELMADGTRLDRLDGSTFWRVPHSQRAHVRPAETTPSPVQGAATLLVVNMPVVDFEALGTAGLLRKVAGAAQAIAHVVSLSYEVDFAYTVLATVTQAQAEAAVATLTGLDARALTIEATPTSTLRRSTPGSQIVASITTQDRVTSNRVQISAANAVAIEAAHELYGTSGTATITRVPTVIARIGVRVAVSLNGIPALARLRQQVQAALSSAHNVSAIPVNSTGRTETQISHAAAMKPRVVGLLCLVYLAVADGVREPSRPAWAR